MSRNTWHKLPIMIWSGHQLKKVIQRSVQWDMLTWTAGRLPAEFHLAASGCVLLSWCTGTVTHKPLLLSHDKTTKWIFPIFNLRFGNKVMSYIWLLWFSECLAWMYWCEDCYSPQVLNVFINSSDLKILAVCYNVTDYSSMLWSGM